MKKSNSNAVTIITGGSGAIGRACAQKLASFGENLVLCSRSNNSELLDFSKELEGKYGVDVTHIIFDLTDEKSIVTSAKDISQNFQINGLVNSAGVEHGSTVFMTSKSKLQEIFEVNFFGQVLFTQYIAKNMMKYSHGSIVNIASRAALSPERGTFAYGSSKAAILYFSKVLAAELGSYGIRVNAICPGPIQSRMLGATDPKVLDAYLKNVALERFGSVTEVANLVEFLLSDASQYITGQSISIDGGAL